MAIGMRKPKLSNNKLTKYGLIIMLVVISAIGVYNFINSKNSVNIEKVNNEESSKNREQDR